MAGHCSGASRLGSSRVASLAGVAALVACELVRRWRRRRGRPRRVPFLQGHWLLGVLPEVVQAARRSKQNELFLKWSRDTGQTFAGKILLGRWVVVTSCPKNIEHVLATNFRNYPKGPHVQSRLADVLGGGIFNADGPAWQRQRKLVMHMLTARRFKEHSWAVVERNAQKLRGILEGCDPGQPVDVFDLLNRYTLDTIGEIGLGTCIGSLEEPLSDFAHAFDRTQQILFWRFVNPLWRLMWHLGVGPEWEARRHIGRLDAHSKGAVRRLREAVGRGGAAATMPAQARESFVGVLLGDAQARGAALSEDFLRDLALNFLIAGRDTTAQALAWTLFCLIEHPEVEARARREVADVCGAHGPTYESLPSLTYLHAVISESLRLYPAVPVNMKTTLQDDTWPDGTLVPAGTVAQIDVYSACRNRGAWGEDADEFRPERWLEPGGAGPGKFIYPVFNAGPRECAGRVLALTEIKTCLAVLLPAVSLELAVPAETITTNAQITIGMGNGLPCFVSSR